jgi:hypothetical protein
MSEHGAFCFPENRIWELPLRTSGSTKRDAGVCYSRRPFSRDDLLIGGARQVWASLLTRAAQARGNCLAVERLLSYEARDGEQAGTLADMVKRIAP